MLTKKRSLKMHGNFSELQFFIWLAFGKTNANYAFQLGKHLHKLCLNYAWPTLQSPTLFLVFFFLYFSLTYLRVDEPYSAENYFFKVVCA